MDDKPVGLVGRVKEKLVETKKEWARTGRSLTGEQVAPEARRLPPGQRLVTSWPVLDLGVKPKVDTGNWCLSVDGLVANTLSLDWREFQALPQTTLVSDIHCVTTWSRYDNEWRGVTAADFLARVQPSPEARFILFHSYDGYTTNLALSAFAAPDVLLASHWQSEPIPNEHGGPVRVVVPKYYFWKSAKWLRAMTFLAEDRPGFWETRGYHNEGDPWKEERYG
jgi:DMSO/TMAO reductase YedYZ molybdopterin-dependent catalytic subunit